MEVDLWEISVVTFPMLPEARISSVKAARAEALAATIRRATALVRAATR
jgi:phage head maturation protease